MSVHHMIQQGQVWTARHQPHCHHSFDALPSGHQGLDQHLPDRGWPSYGVVEILHRQQGIGELSLLLPLIAHLAQQDAWTAWINPPWIPFAPALVQAGVPLHTQVFLQTQNSHDSQWSQEECLRSQAIRLLLVWPERLDVKRVRRLQALARDHRVLCVLFHAPHDQCTPCHLRLGVQAPQAGQMQIHVLKHRFESRQRSFTLRLQDFSRH